MKIMMIQQFYRKTLKAQMTLV